MSQKKIVMAESLIPSDLTTPTLGSNYCLEGYEDMQYGVGVLEGVLDPQYSPGPAVPTGLSKDGSEGMHLSAYMDEETTGLVNLDWLANAVQDPDRLPERPESIPELEAAWSQNNFAAATPHFEQDLYSSHVPKAPKIAGLMDIVTKAMRRSAQGVSLTEIRREAILSAGGDESRIAGILQSVEKEHGLAGNVFIRAAAYPNYKSGKWKDFLKKTSAKYVIVSTEELRNASWIEDGRCLITGKTAVLEVPWKEALAHYVPRLEATGRVAGSGDAQTILRDMFLSTPVQKKGNVEALPKHSGQLSRLGAERISSEKALAALEGRATRATLAKVAKVEHQVSKGLRGDLLRNFIASTFTPVERKNAAGLLLPILQGGLLLENPAPVKHAYADTGLRPNRPVMSSVDPQFNARVKEAALWVLAQAPSNGGDLLKAASLKFGEDVSRRVASVPQVKETLRIAAEVTKIQSRIAQGACGDLLRSIIARSFKPSEMKIATRLLTPILKKTGALDNARVQHTYADTGLRPNRPVTSSFDSDFESEIQSAVKWAHLNLTLHGDLRAGVKENFSEEVSRKAFERKAFSQLESIQKSAQLVSSEVDRGSRGSVLRNFIAKTIRPEHQKTASRLLKEVVRPELLENRAAETKKYAGAEFTHNISASSKKTSAANDARKAVVYVKQAMNEGYAGARLDELIEKRFAHETLKEANEELVQIREAHEGSAGFMYVDSQAYASQAGTTGCDKGALKHRANQIKMVLSMPRCGSCTLAQALPDGTMKCGTYNKILVSASDLDGEDIQMSKQANIKAASQNDAEATASMFAPSWKNDFQLHNASLDEIQSFPEDEKIANLITFGSGLSW